MIATAIEEVSVLHVLPGRLRVHLPVWPGHDGRGLEKELRRIAGVQRVAANRLTPNVLVVFDRHRVNRERLLSELRHAQTAPHEAGEHAAEEDLPPVVWEGAVGSGRFYAKGAPEHLLDRCTRFFCDGTEEPLDAAGRESLADRVHPGSRCSLATSNDPSSFAL